MKRKFGILLWILCGGILWYVIPRHLEEIRKLKEAAANPELMFDVVVWIELAPICYFAAGILAIVGTVLFIKGRKE